MKEIKTELDAYFFGWMISDGCIYYNKKAQSWSTKLKIHKKDESVLDLFMYYDVFKRKGVDKQCMYILSYNREFAKDMMNLGCLPKKSTETSNEIVLPNLDDTLMPYFIRGLFDGDGCYYLRNKSALECTLACKNEILLRQLKLYLDNKLNIISDLKFRKNNYSGIWSFRIRKNEDVKKKTIKNYKIAELEFQERNNIIIGNLNTCYQSLQVSDDNRYTDDYTKKQDIRIGNVYKLPEDFNLDNKGSCGSALHISLGKGAYNYDGFGDTKIITIVNPMFVYRTDTGNSGKIGVKQMFIAAKEAEHNITENLIHFDEIYHNETIAELEDALENKSFNSFSIQEEFPIINLIDLKKITNSLKNKIVSF